MTAAHVLQNTSMTHLALDMAHAAASGIVLAHLTVYHSFVVGRFARGFLAMSREFKTEALKSLTSKKMVEDFIIKSISNHHRTANKQARGALMDVALRYHGALQLSLCTTTHCGVDGCGVAIPWGR